jgi:hypothetical protein
MSTATAPNAIAAVPSERPTARSTATATRKPQTVKDFFLASTEGSWPRSCRSTAAPTDLMRVALLTISRTPGAREVHAPRHCSTRS